MANLNVKQLFTNILNKLKSHDNKIGDTSMGTTATTITGAIAEHEQDISDLNSNLVVKSTPLTVNLEGATGSGTIYKYGRICILTAIITPTVTGANLSLGWIPYAYADSWKPIGGDVWLSCDYYKNNITATAEAKIQSANGVLKVSTPIKDVDLKISGAWISTA